MGLFIVWIAGVMSTQSKAFQVRMTVVLKKRVPGWRTFGSCNIWDAYNYIDIQNDWKCSISTYTQNEFVDTSANSVLQRWMKHQFFFAVGMGEVRSTLTRRVFLIEHCRQWIRLSSSTASRLWGGRHRAQGDRGGNLEDAHHGMEVDDTEDPWV